MRTERPGLPRIDVRGEPERLAGDPLGPLYRRSMFWVPEWQAPSVWSEHVPFAFWLVDVTRARTIVEVSTQPGAAYAAFCQAVKALDRTARCFAVPSSKQGARSAEYAAAADRAFTAFHDPRYSTFSTVVRSTVAEALDGFTDGSVDLLYIDAASGPDAARRDLDAWRPKLSANAVVLLHDVNVRERGFDGSLLWSGLAEGRRHFTFTSGHGLGVLGLGGGEPSPLRFLFDAAADAKLRDAIRQTFAVLGSASRGAASAASGLRERPPTIAVVVPLYNGGDYIETALRSVLSQTLMPDEIVVVDDGSTDGGPAIVERLMRDYPIVLLRQPNGGQSSARNHGVEHSRSELIALLDQDDVWYETHLERLSVPFREPRAIPLGWAYSGADAVDAEGRLVARPFEVSRTHPKRSIVDLLREDMSILPTCTMISREAYERVGGFDERLAGYEDDDFFMRLFRIGYDHVYIDESLGRWRTHDASATWTPLMSRSRAKYLQKLLGEFPDEPQQFRFFTSHYIIPRFVPLLTHEVKKAVAAGDNDAVRKAIADLGIVFPHIGRRQRILLKFALLVVRFRPSAALAQLLQPLLRPIWRRLHS